jgi:hypothetical protein
MTEDGTENLGTQIVFDGLRARTAGEQSLWISKLQFAFIPRACCRAVRDMGAPKRVRPTCPPLLTYCSEEM